MSGSKGSKGQSSSREHDVACLVDESAHQKLQGIRQTLNQPELSTKKHDIQPRNHTTAEASVSEETRTKAYMIYNDLNKKYAEEVGHHCDLCHKDLAFDPERLGYWFPDPAETTVLSCGHVYHFKCLQLTIQDKQSPDPPCILCISCRS